MTVIFFLLNNFILLFKIILLVFARLFLIPNPFVKYILLLLCLTTIYILWKYPRTRFNKLSEVRNHKLNKLTKYALKNKLEHIYNIFVITIFCVVFTIVIFLLRYLNQNKNIDLKEKYILFKNLYLNTPLYDFVFNSIILILIFIIYIWLFIRIIKYFKYHVIKRHIYLVGNLTEGNTWYQMKFFYNVIDKINIYNVHFKLVRKIQEYYEKYYYKKFNKKKPLNFFDLSDEEVNKYYRQSPIDPFLFFTLNKEDRILYHLMTKWHYILLFILLIYDLIYNDYQITHVFYILPWTFFFEIYIRFSTFVEGLWIPHDEYLHTILYAKQLEIWDKETLLIDGDFYDYNKARIIYKTYVARDFVKDPNYL